MKSKAIAIVALVLVVSVSLGFTWSGNQPAPKKAISAQTSVKESGQTGLAMEDR